MIVVFWVAAGLLLYALVIYPSLMWVASRAGQRSVPEVSAVLPSVSLIIPAHNEELVLAAKLANALQLDYPAEKLEIIVVSDGSTDRTLEIAGGFIDRGVKLVELTSNCGKASALNAAVERTTGDILCMSDANVIFRRDALQRMVARLDDPGIGAVSGDVRIASEEVDYGFGEAGYYSIERPIQLGESRIGSMMGVDGGMYVVRRELYRPLPPDTVLDDFVVSMLVIRQGHRVVYEPAAIATENATPTWRQEFRRRVRVKRGALQTIRRGLWPPLSRPVELWQYLSHKPVRWFGPFWLFLLFVASAALWDRGWVYRTALLAQCWFYGVAVLALMVPRLRRDSVPGLAFYFTMSHVAMLVGLIKSAISSPGGVWERTSRAPLTEKARRPEVLDCPAVANDLRLNTPLKSVSAAPGAN